MSSPFRCVSLRLLGHLSLLVNICIQVFTFATAGSRRLDWQVWEPAPAYSPHPILFFTAFAFQVLLQLCWLVGHTRASSPGPKDIEAQAQAMGSLGLFIDDDLEPFLEASSSSSISARPFPKSMVPAASGTLPSSSYIPYYIIGNICMTIWTLAYTSSHLFLAQIVLHINALLQLYAIFFVLKRPGPGPGTRRSLSRFELGGGKSKPELKYLDLGADDYSDLYRDYEEDCSHLHHVNVTEEQEQVPHHPELLSQPESSLFAAISPTSARTDALTTLVAKVFTASTVMYIWKTWGYVENLINIPRPPSYVQQLNAGLCLLFLTIASGPDPTLGICFIYVLLALYLGERSPPSNAGGTGHVHEGQTWRAFFRICATVLGIVLVLDFICTNMKDIKLRRTTTRSLPLTFMWMSMGTDTGITEEQKGEQQEQQEETRDWDERKQADEEEEEPFAFTFTCVAPMDLEVKMTIETEVVVEN